MKEDIPCVNCGKPAISKNLLLCQRCLEAEMRQVEIEREAHEIKKHDW
jgi:NMD protein affecting ribosome stability and mRNA decay